MHQRKLKKLLAETSTVDHPVFDILNDITVDKEFDYFIKNRSIEAIKDNNTRLAIKLLALWMYRYVYGPIQPKKTRSRRKDTSGHSEPPQTT